MGKVTAKKVTAKICPSKIDAIRTALKNASIERMTITEVKVHSTDSNRTEVFSGNEYCIDFIKKMQIEIVVIPNKVETTVAIIAAQAKIQESDISVEDIANVIRISTGEKGAAAV